MVKYSSIMPDRKWKHFPGNNRFYCNGLLISSKQVAILIFLLITIVVTSCLFFAFDCRFMIVEVHPACVLIAVVGLLAMFYSLMFLLKAGCTDPGFLPRARSDEAAYNQAIGDEDPTNTARGFLGTPARYKTVIIKGQEVKLKFCVTCNVFRPPRASHCGLCNNCVENFDHHCPWVGNCVAKRNYRFFYLFLVTVCLSSLYMMSINIAVIVVSSLRVGFVNAIKTYPASLVEFIIAGFCVLAVTGLACFHTTLIANMKTTNEDMKGTFNPRTGLNNPYRRGNFFKNFATVLCGPFQPSLIDRRGYMTEEDGCLQEVSYGATSTTTEQRVPAASEHRDLPPSEGAQQSETTTTPAAVAQDGQLLSIEQDESQLATSATDTKQLLSS